MLKNMITYYRLILTRSLQATLENLDLRKGNKLLRAVFDLALGVLILNFLFGSIFAQTQLLIKLVDALPIIALLLILFLIHLVIEPVKVDLEKSYELSQLSAKLQPRLGITFQERDPFRQVDPAVADGEHIVGRLILYRIAVENLSPTEIIREACIELERIEPNAGIPYLPVPLHLMHDNPPSGQLQRTRFDLNPGQTQYADLISTIESLLPAYNRRMQIWHAVPRVSNLINTGNYRLTVHVHSSNCPDVRAFFLAGTDDGGSFFFRQEETAGSSSEN